MATMPDPQQPALEPEPSTGVDEHDGQELPPPLRADSTLESAVAAYDLFMERKGFSENTVKAFRNDLKIFVGFMGGATLLHQINTTHLEEFLEWMQHERGRPCSAKTLGRRITTIKSFFRWLHGIGVLGTDPAEPIVQQQAKPPLPSILRDADVSRLLRAAQDCIWDRDKPDARPYLLVSLLIQTGMKKAECARLLVSDIDVSNPQAPQVRISYPADDQRNRHKNRTLSLHTSIVPALNQYLKQYKPTDVLFDCTPRNLEYVLDDLGKQAGIKNIQVGFETLRWTSAVSDYRLGLSEEQLREKMGLSKISWRETREKIFNLTGRG